MLLDLYDKIIIKKINKEQDEIKFIGKFRKNISQKNNSISKSLYLLRKYGLVSKKNRYKIVINKKIPVFAGLGGGTSNAVFLTKYFLKNQISKNFLRIF
jgi:4-diphosphocytidyl-2-C-methyl-D-erythritol kinase